MSVTMARTDGVTVFTLNSDPESACPPLCQIFKGLCYSPACCSVSQHLRTVQRNSQSVLGALHIMVGLLNIGIGAILCSGDASWRPMAQTLFPFWFGGVFMLIGTICILSEKCPSPCLVILNVILNLAGAVIAIGAIALYSLNMTRIFLWWMCHHYDYPDYSTDSPSPHEEIIKEKCLEAEELTEMLLRSMNALLIVLSVLELCVTISGAVLGIKAMKSCEKRENKSMDDPQLCNPLLAEVTSNTPA